MTKRTAAQVLLAETAHLSCHDRLTVANAWAWAKDEAQRHPTCDRGTLAQALSLKLMCQGLGLESWVRQLIGKAAAETVAA